MNEKQCFDEAMGAILKADPKEVKAAVDSEIEEHTAERKARGERKRGRKPKAKKLSASGHASGDRS